MIQKIKNFLEGRYALLIIFALGIVFQILGLGHIFAIICATYLLCIFILCDSPINALFIPLNIAFFLNSFKDESVYIYYGIAIGIFLTGLVYFLVKMLAVRKRRAQKGTMFYPFMLLIFAVFIGGAIGHFNPLSSLAVAGQMFIAYVFYFIFINFTANLKEKFIEYSIITGVQIFLQLIIAHLMTGDFWDSISSKGLVNIGVQNINVAAVYLIISMLSMLYLALNNKKHDYLLSLGAIGFFLVIFLSYSRICTLVSAILLLAGYIYIFVKSNNKKIFGIITVSFLLLVAILCIALWGPIYDLVARYISMGISFNGRDVLWPWCFEKFKENPIFGIGFTSFDEPVPGVMTDTVVMAHNSILQYLTSTGLVGSALALAYYVMKYKTIFSKEARDIFVITTVIAIALIGMVDQSPTTDIFVIIILNLLIAISEIKIKSTVPSTKEEKIQV